MWGGCLVAGFAPDRLKKVSANTIAGLDKMKLGPHYTGTGATVGPGFGKEQAMPDNSNKGAAAFNADELAKLPDSEKVRLVLAMLAFKPGEMVVSYGRGNASKAATAEAYTMDDWRIATIKDCLLHGVQQRVMDRWNSTDKPAFLSIPKARRTQTLREFWAEYVAKRIAALRDDIAMDGEADAVVDRVRLLVLHRIVGIACQKLGLAVPPRDWDALKKAVPLIAGHKLFDMVGQKVDGKPMFSRPALLATVASLPAERRDEYFAMAEEQLAAEAADIARVAETDTDDDIVI